MDTWWCTEEPIWIGVSAHLYQTSQRYILRLCFITLEWRDLKCLTALSPSSDQLPHPPPPATATHLVALSCNIGSAERAAVFSSLPASRGNAAMPRGEGRGGGLISIPSRFRGANKAPPRPHRLPHSRDNEPPSGVPHWPSRGGASANQSATDGLRV